MALNPTVSISAEDRFNQTASQVAPPNSFTLNGATPVSVVDAGVTNKSMICITLQTPAGTVGAHPVVQTKTAGAGFTVAGTAADTSLYTYTRIG
jgi:hypothetical protein